MRAASPSARLDNGAIALGCICGELSPPATRLRVRASHLRAINTTKLAACRLVAVDDGGVVDWAAVSPVSPPEVYRGVVEHSIYVSELARGRGVGRVLLSALMTPAMWLECGRSSRASFVRMVPVSGCTSLRAFCRSLPRTHRVDELRAVGGAVAGHDLDRAA
jgi:GNAT superfamily N-acetyltransferase